MNNRFRTSCCVPVLLLLALAGQTSDCAAQEVINSLTSPPTASQEKESKKKDGWTVHRDEQTHTTIMTREMTLYPQAEPRPALKYRMIPDDFDMIDGNAAIYYLKALGFLEQTPAREWLTQFHKEARKRAEKEGKAYSDVPPAIWLSTPPSQLPLEEVKAYLQATSFQPQFIREAAQRNRFDLDRNFREVDDPIAYLLPDIQSMRQLARSQSLRCRVAIAEGRIEDAIAIIGQQFAMARHLGQDEFLVSNLVGIAIVRIAWNDALYLVEQPGAPNLYWAVATIPRPLANIRYAMSIERQLLYQQLKVLREVDEKPRPVGYWQNFVDRFLSQVGYLSNELKLPSAKEHPTLARAAMVGFIAEAYPGAKEYLIKECNLPVKQVNAYPTAQVVFLAIVRFHDRWNDEFFKWTHLPFWQVRTKASQNREYDRLSAASDKYGKCSLPTTILLPAAMVVSEAKASCEQTTALLQTVEAIRMYGATHDGTLPPSLEDLPVPAPIEPFTGKPIDYQLQGDHAVLNGHRRAGQQQYRLVLRFAKRAK